MVSCGGGGNAERRIVTERADAEQRRRHFLHSHRPTTSGQHRAGGGVCYLHSHRPTTRGSTVPGAESAVYILIGGLGLSMVVSLLEFVYKYKRQVVRKKVRPTSSVMFCQFSWDPGPHVLLELPDPVCRLPHGQLQLPRGILFCSLAVLDPTVGHTMDVLSPHISVLCHCD